MSLFTDDEKVFGKMGTFQHDKIYLYHLKAYIIVNEETRKEQCRNVPLYNSIYTNVYVKSMYI